MGANKNMNEKVNKINKPYNIKKRIMVFSGKGGVGKTTVAVNLAFKLALNGNNTGLLDADIHGPDVTKMLNAENTKPKVINKKMIPPTIINNLKIISISMFLPDKDSAVIWRGPLKMHLLKQFTEDVQWGNLDYLIVDLPPGTGDEPLSIVQLMQPDGAIIVTTPQEVALLDSRKAVNFAKKVNVPVIGIIENMSGFKCPYCGKEIDLFKVGGGKKAAGELDVPFLGRIPIDPEIVKSGDSGNPFVLNSNSEASKAFNKIIKKIERFK